MKARDKIWPLTALPTIIDRSDPDQKIVLACGCFDPLHAGHVRHLEEAKGMGDVLVVLVTADRCVNKPGHPAFSEGMRAEVVAALGCVDFVAVNDEYKADDAITTIRPDIYVKGADYKKLDCPALWSEKRAVERFGGELRFTKDEIRLSSTEMLRRLTECV